jgi:hypothetical protein
MKAFVVLALHWEYNDSWVDMDREVPVKAFLSRDDAEWHCLGLELKAREGICRPSWYGGIVHAGLRHVSRAGARGGPARVPEKWR